jgi:hypothetical protein
MIRHTKRDTNTCLSATRTNLHRWMPRTPSADPAKIKPQAARTSQQAFFEDFTGEHSLLRLRSTPIGIPGAF